MRILECMNRMLFLALFFTSVVAHSQVPSYATIEGLEVWYAFNGNWQDQSGNGNHLQYDSWYADSGLQPWPLGGPANGPYLYLSGESVDIPVGAFPYSTGTWPLEFSVAGWWSANWTCGETLLNTSPVDSMVLCRAEVIPSDPPDLDCLLGRLVIEQHHPYWDVQLVSDNLSEGWHHFVIVFDHGEDFDDWARLFVDGVQVDSASYQSQHFLQFGAGPNSGPPAQWEFGFTDSAGIYDSFEGAVAEFGMWNTALTAGDVSMLYEGGLAYGCTNPDACNYSEAVSNDDGTCLLSGCTDALACNYDSTAFCQDTCIYPINGLGDCLSGAAGCGDGTTWVSEQQLCLPMTDTTSQQVLSCGPGTVWNPEVGECVIAVPADTDFDGCVTAGDVLNLLAAFGTCPPVSEWPDVEDEAPSASIDCADSVLYHGHYYQTVIIGEQCWFAENLRTTQYNEPDPDTPLQVVQPSEWASVNGEGLWDGVACVNPMALDTSLGLLYNHHAVFGNGNVCPTDWRVPTTIDWAVLEMELGGSADEVGGVIGWRAYGVGEALKASSEGSCCSEFGWDGSGVSGFDAVPSGYIHPTGGFANTNMAFYWTSDTWSSSHGWRRKLGGGISAIMNEYFFMDGGMSVRCVKY